MRWLLPMNVRTEPSGNSTSWPSITNATGSEALDALRMTIRSSDTGVAGSVGRASAATDEEFALCDVDE
jgi:hypothetical protein